MQLPSSTRNKYVTYLLFILGAFIFFYTVIRAQLLSITWDEAYSYLQFVRHKILIPEKYEAMDANNHVLNTWLNIQSTKFLGVSEFVLRLPSLFGHLLFLFFSYKIVRNFENKALLLASFLIINLNPYLLDFFSLSRGYGLSIGLMMASIYYLYVFITKEYKIKYAVYTTMYGMLATVANFVALNYIVVATGLLLLLMFVNAVQANVSWKGRTIQFIRSAALPCIILMFSLWVLVPIALKLKDSGALFYGGNTGFWKDTVGTIVDRSLYEVGYNYWFQRVLKGLVVLSLLMAACFVVINFFKKQFTNIHVFICVLILLLGLTVLSTIVQHYWFGTLYLIDRTALFFILLFNLLFVFLINEWGAKNKLLPLIGYAAGGLAVCHFVMAMNFTYVLEWKSNADVKQMIADLENVKSIPVEADNVSIGMPLAFSQSVNFYRAVAHRNWINTAEPTKEVNFLNDYLYLEPWQYEKINRDSIEIIKTYPVTKNILAKPRHTFKSATVSLKQELDFTNLPEGRYIIGPENEYSQGFNYIINDSLTPVNNAEIIIKATVSAPEESICFFSLVCSLENEKGTYMWKRAFVKDYIVKANNWVDIYYKCLVPLETKKGDLLKSYIWNTDKRKLHVSHMELKWLNYQY
ncbi:MAG: hypothetical protein V4608_05740 [Bacteroidota bacterium]